MVQVFHSSHGTSEFVLCDCETVSFFWSAACFSIAKHTSRQSQLNLQSQVVKVPQLRQNHAGSSSCIYYHDIFKMLMLGTA